MERKSRTESTMQTTNFLLLIIVVTLFLFSCGRSFSPGSRLYVTNEVSGDLSVIDTSTRKLITTVPLGKRPPGIQPSRDGLTAFVALSGSLMGGPGVDESSLPPPDKGSDGIAVVDLGSHRVRKVLPGGSDPEQFVVSPDGRTLYIANEDASVASIVEVSSGRILSSLPVGGEPEGVALSPDGK